MSGEGSRFSEQQAIVLGGVTAALTMCGLDYVLIVQKSETNDVGLMSSFQMDRVAGMLTEALQQMAVEKPELGISVNVREGTVQ